VAKLQIIRTVAETGERTRTPERQALADAIARRKAITERIARINAAIDVYEERCPYGAVERAEEAVEVARRNEPGRAVALILGDPMPEGQSVEEARQALAEARTADNAATSAKQLLRDQAREAREALISADDRIEREIKAVIESEPAMTRLLEAFYEKEAELASLRRTIASVRLFVPPQFRNWDGMRDCPDARPNPAWRDAIASLATDPDAVLP
jgi:hypothetical protein